MRGPEAGENATDGVVTYQSARLDGVESELVIPFSGHSVQGHPVTVEEVRRILLEHAMVVCRASGIARSPPQRGALSAGATMRSTTGRSGPLHAGTAPRLGHSTAAYEARSTRLGQWRSWSSAIAKWGRWRHGAIVAGQSCYLCAYHPLGHGGAGELARAGAGASGDVAVSGESRPEDGRSPRA